MQAGDRDVEGIVMNKNRLEAFSDGVFAIVITLLVLEIRVPEVDYEHLSKALIDLLPQVFAYVISFGVIGVYWVAHHQSIRLVTKVNSYLIWLNHAYLFVVSCMTFSTALLGRYTMQPLPIVIYGINLIIANIIGVMLARFLRSHPDFGRPYAHQQLHKSRLLSIFINSSYGLAILLGFVAPIVSYIIFVTMLLVAITFYSLNPLNLSDE